MEIQNNLSTFATNFLKTIKMKIAKMACLSLLTTMALAAQAGGTLTNTNQNIHFLRNIARDGAIGIDGVYSNPAGVIFLGEGFHLSLNLQNARQTRTIDSRFPLFVFNAENPGNESHHFKGNADAPIIPSVQVAWNKGRWSWQFGFAITGGGGKCQFDDGLGSFERIVSGIPALAAPSVNKLYQQLAAAGIPGMGNHGMGNSYAYDSYMRGRQYYYGFTLGGAYKLNDNLSVYGGLRLLYGSANYYGYVKNISIEHIDGGQSQMVNASQHFTELAASLNYYAGMMEQMGNTTARDQLTAAATAATALGVQTQDIELNCDQTGWGVAPIIGIDYKAGRLNLAAKYEFKTKMRLKNKSANSESAKSISMLDKYADGKRVAEDSPAMLTVGAQYELLPSLRVMAGYHHYFDVDTKQYTKNMLGDSNEYLFGAEYDINHRIQVSAGVQRTQYDFKDDGMNDISFNVSSYSYGLGVGVNVTEKIKVNAAWFQTLYDDYNKSYEVSGLPTADCFTRTNRVIGIGVDFKL